MHIRAKRITSYTRFRRHFQSLCMPCQLLVSMSFFVAFGFFCLCMTYYSRCVWISWASKVACYSRFLCILLVGSHTLFACVCCGKTRVLCLHVSFCKETLMRFFLEAVATFPCLLPCITRFGLCWANELVVEGVEKRGSIIKVTSTKTAEQRKQTVDSSQKAYRN